MWRVQVVLLASLAGLIPGADVGEAGLADLAAQRAAVTAVEGHGIRTVQRIGDDDAPTERKQVRFAIAADGRYEILLTDPDDPDERTRFVSDGTRAASQEWSMPGEAPVVKQLAVGGQDLLQRILSCLRLDLPRLRTEYAIELRPADGDQRELRLVPTAPAVAGEVAVISVWLDAAGNPLRVVMDDTSGQRHRLDVQVFTNDPVIDPARFTVP
jgi:outer membrane lipoprotein-sorting protein